MTNRTLSLAEAAAAVAEAAIEYLDSDDSSENKDLFYNLEQVAERYKAMKAASAPNYRCQNCKDPIVRGERCAGCGCGWFVEESP